MVIYSSFEIYVSPYIKHLILQFNPNNPKALIYINKENAVLSTLNDSFILQLGILLP